MISRQRALPGLGPSRKLLLRLTALPTLCLTASREEKMRAEGLVGQLLRTVMSRLELKVTRGAVGGVTRRIKHQNI